MNFLECLKADRPFRLSSKAEEWLCVYYGKVRLYPSLLDVQLEVWEMLDEGWELQELPKPALTFQEAIDSLEYFRRPGKEWLYVNNFGNICREEGQPHFGSLYPALSVEDVAATDWEVRESAPVVGTWADLDVKEEELRVSQEVKDFAFSLMKKYPGTTAGYSEVFNKTLTLESATMIHLPEKQTLIISLLKGKQDDTSINN